ncbi:glutathione S-transferase 1-like [Trichoplusia ni]|uniref:Glutathione S-transferase 1-like n=1 Tax=Trichoplusia ni TaxID=7111 RepID=A0A7E5WUC5_TRINI|nr:glutathione S-transferase 1-like [Trichoplusia ni]
MTIKLYKFDGSPVVRPALMLADILKLELESVNVNLRNGDHLKPEYVKKNPNHTIPMLEDDGFIVADSHAILTYLVDKYGQDQQQLYPKELNLRTTVNQRLFFEASTIANARTAALSGVYKNNATGPDEEGLKKVHDLYKILEAYLSKTKFLACDHLTIADLSCVASISALDVAVPIDTKYEKLSAWFNTLKQEQWYKNGNEPGLNIFTQYFKSMVAKNSGQA